MADMDEPENFEILKEYSVFRPTGRVHIEQAVELVTAAITFARARLIRKLLIDASNLIVIEKPSYGSQYFFVRDWARAAAGCVCVAIVVRQERFDLQKFGTTVAANVGFIADSFTTEEDATIWLQSLK
jgi:hypothetical protein